MLKVYTNINIGNMKFPIFFKTKTIITRFLPDGYPKMRESCPGTYCLGFNLFNRNLVFNIFTKEYERFNNLHAGKADEVICGIMKRNNQKYYKI